MSIASADDVAVRLGRSFRSTAEEDLAGVLLDDVEEMIVARIPDLIAQTAAEPPTISVATVTRVEAWVVVRFLKNPDGKFQESIDDYSFTRDRAVSSGMLGLTDDEWDEILPSAGTSSAFTIQSPSAVTYTAAPGDPWGWRW